MLKKRILIIDIPFNIDMTVLCDESMMRKRTCKHLEKAFMEAQTEPWIQRRIDLFMKYTCNSLIHQTNSDFLCLVRYSKLSQTLIYKYLSLYPQLPPNIQFTTEADKIIKEKMQEYDSLYHIKIDSDNMYAPDFIERLNLFCPQEDTLTIMNQNGYLYEESTQRIATIWFSSPSFSVALYNKETFKQLFTQRVFEPHVRVLRKYKYELLEGRNYLVCIHDQNVDNKFGRIYKSAQGKLLMDDERERVLRMWNLM